MEWGRFTGHCDSEQGHIRARGHLHLHLHFDLDLYSSRKIYIKRLCGMASHNTSGFRNQEH